MYSNLDLVKQVDSFPNPSLNPTQYTERLSELALFTHGTRTLGYVLPLVVDALKDATLSGDWWTITATTVSVHGSTEPERTANINRTCAAWRSAGTFKVLNGWRNELYAVYSPAGELYLNIERCAAALFGVVTYGVHLTAYTTAPMKIWVPRRSATKATYGGMLDNTVAGGITSGMEPFETAVKEAAEEASLPEGLIKERVKAVGVLTYAFQSNEQTGGEIGLLQPEVEYIYDLELPADVIPKPYDDEVEEFYLWDVEKVKEELAKGNFKPNCTVVLIDFFIRHGIITAENEPDYLEISSRIHRAHEFPLAHFNNTSK